MPLTLASPPPAVSTQHTLLLCTTIAPPSTRVSDAWHARLVRYYSFFGFEPVRTVGGNGLSDLPHLLVWGGEGTRMDADVGGMLRRWGPAIRRGGAGFGGGGGGGGGALPAAEE